MSTLEFSIPTQHQLNLEVQQKISVNPCLFQVNAALAQLQQFKSGSERRGVVCFSATGSGKTMAFIIPMLFNDNV